MDMDDFLRTSQNQAIYKDKDLVMCEVAAGLPLYELIYQEHDCPLSRDDRLLFLQKVEQSISIDPEAIQSSYPVGTIGLNVIGDDFEMHSVVDWVAFVRADLRSSPGSASHFHKECSGAFPKLRFSTAFPGCLDTMEGGHGPYANAIVDCFSALNDNWFNCFSQGAITDALEKLQALANHRASMEGQGGDRKKQLTFSFAIDGKSTDLICEPHLKIRSPDQAGDNSRNNERIYFYPREVEGQQGNVFVGHAGAHL